MKLNGRLGRLEEARRKPEGERCPTCVEWPPCRVVYVDADWRTTTDRGRPPLPAACPACGWRPTTIEVVYGEVPR